MSTKPISPVLIEIVRNGVIELLNGTLPEGAQVQVRLRR